MTPAVQRRPHIAFLVNGDHDSAMGIRARSLAAACGDAISFSIAYRGKSRVKSIADFRCFLSKQRPDVVYVLDMAYSGVLAAAVYRATHRRARMIIDTGDAITALARSSGMRGPIGLALTAALERFGLCYADHIVPRGTFHAELLAERLSGDAGERDRLGAAGCAFYRAKFELSRTVDALRQSGEGG